MPRVTYAQLVNEAVAAMNEGDYQIAAELFRASLPLRMAENIEDSATSDNEGVEACSSCHRPMGVMRKYTCDGCGSQRTSRVCDACSGRTAMRCSACGGAFRPSRSPVAYITADQIRTALAGDADVETGEPFIDFPATDQERSINPEIAGLMRAGPTKFDPEELPEGDPTRRDPHDLKRMIRKQMEDDWRLNDDKLPDVDPDAPDGDLKTLMLDVIRKIRDRSARPSLLNRIQEKTRAHGEPLDPYFGSEGGWGVKEIPKASRTGVPGGNIGDIRDMMTDFSSHYPTADQIRTAAKLKYETRQKMQDGSFACSSSHPKVKDDKDHFPIEDLAHGRNAMARVNQYNAAPPWWGGSLAELKNTVTRAVHSRYPALTDRTEERAASVVTARYDDGDGEERRNYDRQYHRGGKRHPCPTCKRPNSITDAGRKAHHQCDECADRAENGEAGY